MFFKICTTFHWFKKLYKPWKNYSYVVNQCDKIILDFKKDINAHYTIFQAWKYFIYMSLPAKNLVYQPAPCCRWNIIFNISRVSLREFRPLINFEPLCTVLNGNCQTSAIAREKLSRTVAMSISAKTNRNPAIYPDAPLIWRNCPSRRIIRN